MKILADYHTHTIYSHGKGTIEDNVKIAISKGIETLGISDHSYKHLTYGIKKNDIFKMREEIDLLNEKYKDKIKILLGVECNILDDNGNIDYDDKIGSALDYVMAGYHFGSKPTNLKCLLNHANNYIFKSNKSKESNTILEINSSHKFLNVDQLKKIEHIENTFIVGSDAHIPQNVGNFDLALNTIKEAKIDLSLIENIKF